MATAKYRGTGETTWIRSRSSIARAHLWLVCLRCPQRRQARRGDASSSGERLTAALQEVAFGRVLGAGDRRLVRQRRLGVAAQASQQVGADGVEDGLAFGDQAAIPAAAVLVGQQPPQADGLRAEVLADKPVAPALAV
jgi:hypothetical protein